QNIFFFQIFIRPNYSTILLLIPKNLLLHYVKNTCASYGKKIYIYIYIYILFNWLHFNHLKKLYVFT
ncbi:MAG: hypothetical protein MCS20_01970, partial [Candidatus Phytoplasma mali]|nr:hypothetical protein [Candidatus Phytoplasma australiense]MCG7202157.1 hypothetical protein [Candidatus Phytoplasma mali]MCZ8632756.1 hypothetical protein [Spiroplasma sp. Tabriz.8]